jgi:glycosyltransferase involved in cell wall biosynthesis
LKVLQIILTQGFSGAERVVYSLSKGLLKAGIDVPIVTTTGLQEKFSALHAPRMYVLSGYAGSLPRRIATYMSWTAQLREIISKEKPDIIHVHGTLAKMLLVTIHPDCPVVETLHGIWLRKDEAFLRTMHIFSDELAALSFSGNIFYMRAIAGSYSRLRSLRPTEVIYNPVDEDFLAMVSVPMDSPVKEGKYILWCGRLTRFKGAHLLLQAFASLKRSDISLIILSDGPERPRLEELAKSLGVQQLTHFLGFVDERRKAQFFQHASIICTNVTNPELSQAVLEAVSTGNPVVACYAPEVYEAFGSNISLLRSQSVEELAVVLAEKLTNGDAFSTENRKILRERFSLPRFTEQHIAFYQRIIRATS